MAEKYKNICNLWVYIRQILCYTYLWVIKMPILNKENKKELEKYKSFLLDNKNYNILQSLEWAELKDKWINEIVYIEKNNKIIASVSLLLRRIPIINSYIAYGARGPLVDINDIETLNLLLEEIKLLRNKYNIFLLRFDPRWDKKKLNNSNYKKIFKIRGEKISTKLNIQPRLNMIIDLEREREEDLFKSFSKSTKRNIKLAIRNNCKVEIDNSITALEEFYKLHKITGDRDKFMIRSLEYFKKLYSLYDKNTLNICKVTHEDTLIGSAIFLSSGDTLWYYAGASANVKRNLKANHLLQWEMIKWAKKKGYKYYDLGGIYSTDSNIESLYIFKRGFCKVEGVTEFIGELDYIYNKLQYFLYICMEKLNIIRKKIFKLINNFKEKSIKDRVLNEYELNNSISSK